MADIIPFRRPEPDRLSKDEFREAALAERELHLTNAADRWARAA